MYIFKGSHLRNNVKSVRLADVLQCAVPRSTNVWTKAANKMYFPPSEGAVVCRHRKSNGGMKLTGENRVAGEKFVPLTLRPPQISQGLAWN